MRLIGNLSVIILASLLQALAMQSASAQQGNCPATLRDARGQCPTPLKMERGAYGVAVTGHLTQQNYRATYALDVDAGQTVIVSFVGAHDMTGEISCGDTGDGPWGGTGNSYTVKQSETCYISVGANTRSGDPWNGNFTLAVLATPPQRNDR